ncbi:hypothetical protein QLQ15_00760 [Lysobacter sp. LF1]|uniref:Uncharacterized protein n=1 Tax=Lysobacter stagni TaxID=3045172 RepID=A0ABT6XBC7_9GAMM|nr:hypothetical protein [Lysobacter sp. LF1]MDI9237441.1 hypothetical protein [Lysobacter sp. LF1]
MIRNEWKTTAALALLVFAAVPVRAADDGTKALPPDVQATVNDIAKQMAQVRETDVELSCDKGVENARYGLETMLEVGQKNADGGYIKREEFNAMATQLRGFLSQITVADCQSAEGEKQAFYRCMSSDYNHVTACAAKHRF